VQRVAFLAAAPVFALVVLLYIPTLRGGFVYDSIAQVLYSDDIHTTSNGIDVLSLRVVGQDELDRNRPLHLASLMLDAAVWKKDPFGYRLTSVLLHALNTALLLSQNSSRAMGRPAGVRSPLVQPPSSGRLDGYGTRLATVFCSIGSWTREQSAQSALYISHGFRVTGFARHVDGAVALLSRALIAFVGDQGNS
jgi:hypothetical protein